MGLDVIGIPVLADNYVWMIHEPASGETVVVDPATSSEVLAEADHRGWTITQIWNTHWHADHIGGNAAIKAATGCRVTAPAAEATKIDTLDFAVGEGDIVRIGNISGRVWDAPAHTAGHVFYGLPAAGIIFVGDTLFAMGCGCLFEGTAAQMFTNMQRLAALPGTTLVYCAHEYTLSNGRYAILAEPDNVATIARIAEVEHLRAKGVATVPTTIAQERATNPFMRAVSVEQLAQRRAAKDVFKG